MLLASYKYFQNWPQHLTSAALRLPKNLREGLFATHYSHASWTPDQPQEVSSKSALAKALIWRIRNSKFDVLSNYLRFLAVSRLPLSERLSKSAYYATKVLPSMVVSQAREIKELLKKCDTIEEILEGVGDTRLAFLITSITQMDSRLRNAGWTSKSLRGIGKVWIRPQLSKIMGSLSSQH
jgi:hypothetical protein